MPSNFSVSYYLVRSMISHVRCPNWRKSGIRLKLSRFSLIKKEGRAEEIKLNSQKLFSMSFSFAQAPVWGSAGIFYLADRIFFPSMRKASVRHVFQSSNWLRLVFLLYLIRQKKEHIWKRFNSIQISLAHQFACMLRRSSSWQNKDKFEALWTWTVRTRAARTWLQDSSPREPQHCACSAPETWEAMGALCSTEVKQAQPTRLSYCFCAGAEIHGTDS